MSFESCRRLVSLIVPLCIMKVMYGEYLLANNKLDWIIVGNSESNTMRLAVMIVVVVVVFINIIRKHH